MSTEFDAEEVARDFVAGFLLDGPGYLDVSEVTNEFGGSADDVEAVYDCIRDILRELGGYL